jgi:excisionase family DNA binding protein
MSNFNKPTGPTDPAERLRWLAARPYVQPREACELLRLSLSSVRRAIAAGEIQTVRVGRRCLIPTAALLSMGNGD